MTPNSTGQRRVAIIHPWFPEYRKEMFDAIIAAAAKSGIQLSIFYGATPPEWRARGDEVSASYAVKLPTRFLRIGKRVLILKTLRPLRESGPWDLIVVEQVVRAFETYWLMLMPHRRLAMWGHGGTYTQKPLPPLESLKTALTNRVSWFLAYTKSGATRVNENGFPANRVTVLNNTIDSTKLVAGLARLSDERKGMFRQEYDLRGETALFIGGLDEPKRIPFLLDAAARVAATRPGFRLLVVGDGDYRGIVERAARTTGYVKYVGRSYGDEKHLALSESEVIAMPGRIGLITIDSFASGLPIVTTNWPLHAPEFDYLESGRNALVTGDSVEEYAEGINRLLLDRAFSSSLSSACRSDADKYTLDRFAMNFVAGLEGALSASRRGV